VAGGGQEGGTSKENEPEDSKLGKKLSELTTKMVMIIVLAFMFSLPAFTTSTYKNDSEKFNYGLRVVADFFEPPILTYTGPANSTPKTFSYNLTEIMATMPKLQKPYWNVSYQSEKVSRVFNASLWSYIGAHKNLRNPLIIVSIGNKTFWASDQTLQ